MPDSSSKTGTLPVRVDVLEEPRRVRLAALGVVVRPPRTSCPASQGSAGPCSYFPISGLSAKRIESLTSPCSDGPRAASVLGGVAFACKTSRGRQAGPAQCGRRQPSPDSPSSPHELLSCWPRWRPREERGDVEHRGSRSLNHRIIAVPQIRLSCQVTGGAARRRDCRGAPRARSASSRLRIVR